VEKGISKIKNDAPVHASFMLRKAGVDESVIRSVEEGIIKWVEIAYNEGQHSMLKSFDEKINQCYEGFDKILRGEGSSVLR